MMTLKEYLKAERDKFIIVWYPNGKKKNGYGDELLIELKDCNLWRVIDVNYHEKADRIVNVF